jgi:hypothetical protein
MKPNPYIDAANTLLVTFLWEFLFWGGLIAHIEPRLNQISVYLFAVGGVIKIDVTFLALAASIVLYSSRIWDTINWFLRPLNKTGRTRVLEAGGEAAYKSD